MMQMDKVFDLESQKVLAEAIVHASHGVGVQMLGSDTRQRNNPRRRPQDTDDAAALVLVRFLHRADSGPLKDDNVAVAVAEAACRAYQKYNAKQRADLLKACEALPDLQREQVLEAARRHKDTVEQRTPEHNSESQTADTSESSENGVVRSKADMTSAEEGESGIAQTMPAELKQVNAS